MKDILRSVRGNIVYGTLLASALVAFLSIAGMFVAPTLVTEHTDMRIEPVEGSVGLGETFTVQVIVESDISVNVFKGQVQFDHTVLTVDAIDYNTSIADLWAELPWYENGEGTVGFAGGTTRRGGFVGVGSLITITFKTLSYGDTTLRLEESRVLAHDGLGTDVPLQGPLDALFTVEESVTRGQTIAEPETTMTELTIMTDAPMTDLNGDGKQTVADMSMFMLDIVTDNLRSDFNKDGTVDSKDLSILMSAR